jgi:hypothetical protein
MKQIKRVTLIFIVLVLFFFSLKSVSGDLATKQFIKSFESNRKIIKKEPAFIGDYLAAKDMKSEKDKKLGTIMKSVNAAHKYYSESKKFGYFRSEENIEEFYGLLGKMVDNFKSISFKEAAGFSESSSEYPETLFSYVRTREISALTSLLISRGSSDSNLHEQQKKIPLTNAVEALLKYTVLIENYNRIFMDAIITSTLKKDVLRLVYEQNKKGLLSESDRKMISQLIKTAKSYLVDYEDMVKREIDFVKHYYFIAEKDRPAIFAFYKYFHESPIKELDDFVKIKTSFKSNDMINKRYNDLGPFTKSVIPRFPKIDKDLTLIHTMFDHITANRFDKLHIKPLDFKRRLGSTWNRLL